MKFTLSVLLLGAAVFLQACTTTYDLTTSPRESHPWMETQYRTYQDFLTEVQGKTVRIVLAGGQEIDGVITRADADSIGWTSTEDRTVHVLPASGLQSLEITHHYHLWWLGGLVGLLGSSVPMVAAGGWEESDKGQYSYRLAVVGGGLTGALVGGLAASAIHHTDHYRTGTPAGADTSLAPAHR